MSPWRGPEGAWLLARRNLSVRRGRTALFLAGFALAVAVMITLLSVGDAIVEQARDKDLVGGGDLVLVPQGADVDVLKLGGVTAMFSTIPDARFVVRQVVGGARLAGEVSRVEATWAGRPVFLRFRGAMVQSLAGAGDAPGGPTGPPAGGAPWRPTEGEADLAAPSGPAVYRAIDHGHLPDPAHVGRARWAEWDYFNFVDPATGRFAYLSYFLAGDPRAGAVASLSVQIGAPGEPVVRYAFAAPGDTTTIATDDARVTIRAGGALPAALAAGARARGLTVDPSAHAAAWSEGGRYLLSARYRDLRSGQPVAVDLALEPSPRAWGPPLTVKGTDGFESGYVVPVLIGRARGTIAVGARRFAFEDAPAYHDHNWGYWRAVRWEWGQTQSADGAYGLVFGAVHAPEITAGGGRERRFAFLTSRDGFLGAVEPDSFVATGTGPATREAGRALAVPGALSFTGRQGDDSLAVRFDVASVAASRPLGDPRVTDGPRLGGGRVFLQMRGTYHVGGRVAGRVVAFTGPGAAETFVPAPAEPGDAGAR